MAGSVGVFSAEGGSESIDLAEGQSEALGLKLTRDRQVCLLAEKVFGSVDGAVRKSWRTLDIEGREPEHLAGALTVGTRDDGGVHIDKSLALIEVVQGLCGDRTKTEHCRVGVCAHTQVGNFTQELKGMLLLLKRIIGGRFPFHRNLFGHDFKGLLGFGSELNGPLRNERRADVLLYDLPIIIQLAGVEQKLHTFEAAPVVKLDKADGFGVSDRFCPTADGYSLAFISFRVFYQVDKLASLHGLCLLSFIAA
ncbi:hypothetical protein SDC9_82266 [bioreactor metagenome]|uniref:Uncharacterized protein n=1 Tax=bioreactor metagenome TaxID=1076179 RepID=A0A644ZAE2_9ZZZZ